MEWRYTAEIRSTLTSTSTGAETQEDITRPYEGLLIESESEGISRAEGFLQSLQTQYGDKLRWLTLQKRGAEGDEWEDVRRWDA